MSPTKTSESKSINNSPIKQILSKVPEITIYFWIIKVLCTTVGETAADFLNTTLNLGLTGTTLVMGTLLIIALFFQFRLKKYVPSIYWLAVVLISIVGTLITDNLTDNLGVSLVTTTIVFAIILAIVFTIWYISEKTLSIHSIYTKKREAFYWSAVLFTFALGTAAGDLTAERMDVGYLNSAFLFAGLITLIAIIHYIVKTVSTKKYTSESFYAILAFWAAYILTRPLGASIGDYLSQAHADGGLELGTIVTSAIFLMAILITVIYLSITKKDKITVTAESENLA